MPNVVEVQIKGSQNVSDDFDAVSSSAKTTAKTVSSAMDSTGSSLDDTAKSSTRLGDAFNNVGDRSGRLVATFGDVQSSIGSIIDLTNSNAEKQQRQARALNDVDQAYNDMEQAVRDASQAMIDLDQAQNDVAQSSIDAEQAALDVTTANLDAEEAQQAYNDTIKKYGANSLEARKALGDLNQAKLDAKQAQQDLTQAELDGRQATEDYEQANNDLKQAQTDATGAQLDLNDAQREVKESSGMRAWLNQLNTATPAILGVGMAVQALVGMTNSLTLASVRSAAAAAAVRIATLASAAATGIATAAQWAWNIAFASSGIGTVIVLVGLLIAAIVFIATKTTWFQDLWNWVWGKIGDPVKEAIGWIVDVVSTAWDGIVAGVRWVRDAIVGAITWAVEKSLPIVYTLIAVKDRIIGAFNSVRDGIVNAFRYAFNMVSRLWNNTVGRLHFSVPGWVPQIGGNSFSAPKLPYMQHGGEIRSDGLFFGHKGERIIPATTNPLTDVIGPNVGVTTAPSGNPRNFDGTVTLEIEVKSGASEALIRELLKMLSFRVTQSGGSIDALLNKNRVRA